MQIFESIKNYYFPTSEKKRIVNILRSYTMDTGFTKTYWVYSNKNLSTMTKAIDGYFRPDHILQFIYMLNIIYPYSGHSTQEIFDTVLKNNTSEFSCPKENILYSLGKANLLNVANIQTLALNTKSVASFMGGGRQHVGILYTECITRKIGQIQHKYPDNGWKHLLSRQKDQLSRQQEFDELFSDNRLVCMRRSRWWNHSQAM